MAEIVKAENGSRVIGTGKANTRFGSLSSVQQGEGVLSTPANTLAMKDSRSPSPEKFNTFNTFNTFAIFDRNPGTSACRAANTSTSPQ